MIMQACECDNNSFTDNLIALAILYQTLRANLDIHFHVVGRNYIFI